MQIIGKNVKTEVNSTDEYNEGMGMEEDINVNKEVTSNDPVHRKVDSPAKKRRCNDTDADQDSSKGKDSPLHIQEEKNEDYDMDKTTCIISSNRRKADWRNFET